MTCPICNHETDDNCCPICGFTGLDLLFLSKQDWEIWMKTVVTPYRNKVSCRLIAGKRNYFLLSAGRLYGWGGNPFGILTQSGNCGEYDWDTYEFPVFIAKNVTDACCTSNYLIYLTGDGKLHYRGGEDNRTMERIDLEGLNGKVKALYGYSGFNSNGNTILLKLMNGSYALLGDKQDFLPKNIIHSEVFSYDFSDINYEERFYLECGLEMYLAYPPTESDYERMIKQDVNKLPRIKELENQYGCRNVEYEVISGYGLRGKVKVTVYDRVIYCLEPLNKSFDPCHIDNGLPLLKDTKLLSQAIGM